MKLKHDLSINQNGNLRPGSRSFDKSYTYITPGATNLNATPMFYIGDRTNVIWSSLSPQAPNTYAIYNFGTSSPVNTDKKKEKSKTKNEKVYDNNYRQDKKDKNNNRYDKNNNQGDKKQSKINYLTYFGNIPTNIFGFHNNTPGAMRPSNVPNVNINLDQRGNYKLIDNMGKQYKLYSDSHGNFIRHQNNKLYL